MKIFLTGGTGFNGNYLIRELEKKRDEILVLTRNNGYVDSNNVKYVIGDLSNISEWENKLKKFSPDVGIHLAWDGIPNDYGPLMSAKNLRNSLNLLLLFSEVKCKKIVFIGTCWEYGIGSGMVSESMEANPRKPIAIAKHSLYRMANEIANENEINLVWARPFYVYGPERDKKTLIPSIVNSLANNQKPEIRNMENSFDFIYVEDVARAISELARSENVNGVYNVGSGKSTTIKEIVKIVYDNLGIEFPTDFENSARSKRMNFWADISKIKQDTDWQPIIDIKDGISRSISRIKR